MPLHKMQQDFINSSIEHFFYDLPTDKNRLIIIAGRFKNLFNKACTSLYQQHAENKEDLSEDNLIYLCLSKPELQFKQLEKYNKNVTIAEVQQYLLLFIICQLQYKLQGHFGDEPISPKEWLKKFDCDINENEIFTLQEDWLAKLNIRNDLKILDWNLDETLEKYTPIKQQNILKKFVTSCPVDHGTGDLDFALALPESYEKIYYAKIISRRVEYGLPQLDLEITTYIDQDDERFEVIEDFEPIPFLNSDEAERAFCERAKQKAISIAEQNALAEALDVVDENEAYVTLEEGHYQVRENLPGVRLLLYTDYFNLVLSQQLSLRALYTLSLVDTIKLQSPPIRRLLCSNKCYLEDAIALRTYQIKVIEHPSYINKVLSEEIKLKKIQELPENQCKILILPPITNAFNQNKISFSEALTLARIIIKEKNNQLSIINLITQSYCINIRLQALLQKAQPDMHENDDNIDKIKNTLREIARNESIPEKHLLNQTIKLFLLSLRSEIYCAYFPEDTIPDMFKKMRADILATETQEKEEKTETDDNDNWFRLFHNILNTVQTFLPIRDQANLRFFLAQEKIIANKTALLCHNIAKLAPLNELVLPFIAAPQHNLAI